MKSFNSQVLAVLLLTGVAEAVDLSDKVVSFSNNANKIEIILDRSSAVCVTSLEAVLKSLNAANKIIVSAPKFSDCSGQDKSAVISFF